MLKFNRYTLLAIVLISCAISLRMVLAALGWPPTNSDEGTMAIMALNIARLRDAPLIFYGQNYMGTLEAYIGSLFFTLFGPSIFTLRLGIILLFGLFLISTYQLASLLFKRPLALLTLFVLSIGSGPFLLRHIIATGGSAETLLFGSLAFLLATRLALVPPSARHARPLARLLALGSWGVIIGLGFWSDMIVLPFFALAGLLVLLFCWRELWPLRWLAVAAGFIIGMLPQLVFDIQHRLNPLTVLFGLTEGSNARAPHDLHGILHNIVSTLQVSLPTATGQPFCPVMEVPVWGLWGPTLSNPLACTVVRAGWGSGYVLLLGAALFLAIRGFRQLRLSAFTRVETTEDGREGETAGDHKGSPLHEAQVLGMARLLLAGAALLALSVYTLSSGPVDQPGFHARYLVTLLIATPALLNPLWQAAERLKVMGGMQRFRTVAARALLLVIVLFLLAGTIFTFLEVPRAQDVARGRQALLSDIQRAGIKHFYTNYWTCYDLLVASNEGVICAVLDPPLRPTHNRAPFYYDIVQNDPTAALVFPRDSVQLALTECQFVNEAPSAYRRLTSGDYVIYQPILDGPEQPANLRQAIGPGGVQIWRPACDPVIAASGK